MTNLQIDPPVFLLPRQKIAFAAALAILAEAVAVDVLSRRLAEARGEGPPSPPPSKPTSFGDN